MKHRFALLALMLAALLALAGCSLRGKPGPGPEVPRPDSVLDPVVLYRENCSACHGAEGKHGPAMTLGDPVYLAIVDDDALRIEVIGAPLPHVADNRVQAVAIGIERAHRRGRGKAILG